MNLRHIAMIASLSVTGLVPLSMAAPTTAPAEQNGDIVTRVYDISDLLWQKTDYPVSSDDTTGAGGGSSHNRLPIPMRTQRRRISPATTSS